MTIIYVNIKSFNYLEINYSIKYYENNRINYRNLIINQENAYVINEKEVIERKHNIRLSMYPHYNLDIITNIREYQYKNTSHRRLYKEGTDGIYTYCLFEIKIGNKIIDKGIKYEGSEKQLLAEINRIQSTI